jgi:NAD kinase
MLLDEGKPKVQPSVLKGILEKAGFEVGDQRPDVGVVVGGDGRFSRYGRIEDIPLLFVGVRSRKGTGSKAFMARAQLYQLPGVLEKIRHGQYRIENQGRLEVAKNGKLLGRVFTDVYLQRGADSTCIRYKVKATGEGIMIKEEAVGDGIVVSTSAGSSGYYSYPDRIRGETVHPIAHTTIGRNMIGVCHIVPTYTEREGSNERPLRYTLPWGTVVELSIFRHADARIYGTSDSHDGIRVDVGDKVTVRASNSVTKIIVPRA